MTRARLLLVGIAAAALFAAWMLFMPHSPSALRDLAEQAGPFAPLAFLVVWTVATPSLVSGTLLASAGGLLFGPFEGALITIAGAGIGGAVAFALARRIGGDGLGTIGGRAARMVTAVERRGFRSVLCLRAAPAVPATMLNYAAGLSKIRMRDFVLASAIGGAPRGIAYAVLGSNASNPAAWAVALPVVILVVMAIVGLVVARGAFKAEPLPST